MRRPTAIRCTFSRPRRVGIGPRGVGEAAAGGRYGAADAAQRRRPRMERAAPSECRTENGAVCTSRTRPTRLATAQLADQRRPSCRSPARAPLKDPATTSAARHADATARHPGQGRRLGALRHRRAGAGNAHRRIAPCPVDGGKSRSVTAAKRARASHGVRRVLEVAAPACRRGRAELLAPRRRAGEALRIEWDRGSGTVFSTRVLHEQLRRALEQKRRGRSASDGDADRASAAAARTHRALYVPFLAHAAHGTAELHGRMCARTRASLVGYAASGVDAASVARVLGPAAREGHSAHDLLGGGFGRRATRSPTTSSRGGQDREDGQAVRSTLVLSREDDTQRGAYQALFGSDACPRGPRRGRRDHRLDPSLLSARR